LERPEELRAPPRKREEGARSLEAELAHDALLSDSSSASELAREDSADYDHFDPVALETNLVV